MSILCREQLTVMYLLVNFNLLINYCFWKNNAEWWWYLLPVSILRVFKYFIINLIYYIKWQLLPSINVVYRTNCRYKITFIILLTIIILYCNISLLLTHKLNTMCTKKVWIGPCRNVNLNIFNDWNLWFS